MLFVGFMTFLWFKFFMAGKWTLVSGSLLIQISPGCNPPGVAVLRAPFSLGLPSPRKDTVESMVQRQLRSHLDHLSTRPRIARVSPTGVIWPPPGLLWCKQMKCCYLFYGNPRESFAAPPSILRAMDSHSSMDFLKLVSPNSHSGGSIVTGLLNNCPGVTSESGFPSMQD